nr:MAG TPA: hypothetical protein [Caudoviricetes sp.]
MVSVVIRVILKTVHIIIRMVFKFIFHISPQISGLLDNFIF